MTAPERVALGFEDFASGRAFAHPDHIITDRATLNMLMTDFRRHLDAASTETNVVIRYIPTEESWFRRVIIPGPLRAAARDGFTIVGFFGRRRDEVAPAINEAIDELGKQLDAAIPSAPGVLGYTTHLLADEKNYSNLVVLESPDAILQWRNMSPHPHAAELVSPGFYDHVRIYHGQATITGPEPTDVQLDLQRVKYWDFRDQPTWHAVRELV